MTFVTGGTGVLGAHLLLELLRNGKKVKALCRRNSKKETVKHVFSYYTNEAETLFNSIEWCEGDLLDFDRLSEVIEGSDEIYHVAAIVSFDPSKADEMKYLNRQGTANIVNIALEHKTAKFCHVSSIAALGDPKNNEAVNEETERSNSVYHSAYSVSKFESEMEVWRGIAEGLNAVIVNPSIILSPGNWQRSSAKLFDTVWKGFRFSTPGSSGYVDVRDVAKIMFELMEKDIFGQRYLLNSECWSYHKLFSSIAVELRKPIPNIKINKFVLSLVEKLIRIKTSILGGEALISKDTIQSAFSTSNYSNEKVKKQLEYEFIPVEKSIKDISALFMKDHNQQ